MDESVRSWSGRSPTAPLGASGRAVDIFISLSIMVSTAQQRDARLPGQARVNILDTAEDSILNISPQRGLEWGREVSSSALYTYKRLACSTESLFESQLIVSSTSPLREGGGG